MPSSPKNFIRFLVLASPIMLTACGDGWEMVRVTDIVPYGNSRTAGSGVAYVRAQMLPEKELKLEPAVAPAPMTVAPPVVAAPPPPPPAPAKAEEIFREQQSK